MIDIKIAALTGILGLVAVDSGIPVESVHKTLFIASNEYTSQAECLRHIATVERQKPALKGSLSCRR